MGQAETLGYGVVKIPLLDKDESKRPYHMESLKSGSLR